MAWLGIKPVCISSNTTSLLQDAYLRIRATTERCSLSSLLCSVPDLHNTSKPRLKVFSIFLFPFLPCAPLKPLLSSFNLASLRSSSLPVVLRFHLYILFISAEVHRVYLVCPHISHGPYDQKVQQLTTDKPHQFICSFMSSLAQRFGVKT